MGRIEQLQSMLESAPQDSFLQHALALEYIKAGDDVSARALFEKLLAHDPGYHGSYYHLGKLLERQSENERACEVYEKGLTVAKAAGDMHAFSELRAALDDAMDQ